MLKSAGTKLLLVAVLCAGAAACDEEAPPPPTTPTPTVTETFTGDVSQNGAQTHNFSTAASGVVTATLKEVAPDSSLVIGFSLGNWTGSSCQIVLANDAATGGAILTGTMSGIGNLCLRMYDVGNVPAAGATYRVEIVHP
jgi:hypothetical protein